MKLILATVVLVLQGTLDICSGSPVREIAVSSHNLTGDSMLQLGTSLNNSLVTMLGHAMVNLEEYINTNVVDLESRFAEKICELSPCTSWSTWTHCTSKNRDTFGGQTRTRTCWEGNTLPCANDGEQVVENESRVCEGICPSGYVYYSNNGLCLMVIADTMTRPDSEKKCNEKGGHLINTDTIYRWNAVVEIGISLLSSRSIWVDGLRTVQGGTWIYISGVEPTENGLQHWKSGEPSNGGNELCKVADQSGGQYYWYDRECAQSYYAVCEFRL